MQRCKDALEHGTPLRALQLAGDDLKRLRGFQFLSAKPLLLVINLDEDDVADVGADIARAADKTGPDGISRARVDARRRALREDRAGDLAARSRPTRTAFLSDLGLTESGLDRVIRTSYDLLGYISFFTVGEDECRAWSIARGTPAQLAAGEIHTRHPARLHPRRSRRLRRAHRARLDGRVPRSRRGPPRRQGIHRPGRRYHQFPPRHLSDTAPHSDPGGAGAVRARRRRDSGARARRARSTARGHDAQVVSVPVPGTIRKRSCSPARRRGGCST